MSWSTIHFPRLDYSSYCTPANVGCLPGAAWLGPAFQAQVRETYASWGVQQPSTRPIYQRPTHHSIIPLTHNCISSYSLHMLLWVFLLMPSSIFLLSTNCQSKSISRRQCSQLNGRSHLLPHRPNIICGPGYYVSSSRACSMLVVPFISPCSSVARWRPQGRIAVIRRVVPVRSESWVNCEESIYSWPIVCRLARSLTLYPPHASHLAFYQTRLNQAYSVLYQSPSQAKAVFCNMGLEL